MKYDFARFFDFMVIDDSKLDLIIAQKMLKRMCEAASIQTFEQAQKALSAITERAPVPPQRRTVLLIDLRMPLMDGFQFAEAFAALPETLRQQYIPCILTSSISEVDRRRAESMPVIHAFLNKPPDAEKLTTLLSQYIHEHRLTPTDASHNG